MFTRYNFTHVAHMAAQAGVRYSLHNPQAYVTANVECQLALIDTLKQHKVSYMAAAQWPFPLMYNKYVPVYSYICYPL